MDRLLRNARLHAHTHLVDIKIEGARIAAVTPAPDHDAATGNLEVWDLDGRVVLPGLVETHTHLDKTYLPAANHSGTLLEAIDIWRAIKAQRGYTDVRAAALRAVQQAVAHGVTALRSHVDTEAAADLTTVQALLDLRAAVADVITVQLVALGDAAGTPEQRDTLRTALEMGVDCVGGAPVICPDPHATIDAALDLAQEFDKPVDLHIDETEDPAVLTLAYLAEQTVARDMAGRVTAGHCCSLAFVDDATAARVMDAVAAARINIITLPSCNLVLMGRGLRPSPRGGTRVKELLARGVRVCAGSDNVQDPFNPFGGYDPLRSAFLNAHTAHMTGEDELYAGLDMVTGLAARTLGLDDYGFVPGAAADLVVLDATRVLDAVIDPPPRLATFARGRLVVRSEVTQRWDAAPFTAT